MPKRAASALKVLQAGYKTIALSRDKVKEELRIHARNSTAGIRQLEFDSWNSTAGIRQLEFDKNHKRSSSADALACDSAPGRLRLRLLFVSKSEAAKQSVSSRAPQHASGWDRQRTASYASRLRPVNSFGDSIPRAAKSVGAISHSAPCSPLSLRSTPVPLARANGTSAVV